VPPIGPHRNGQNRNGHPIQKRRAPRPAMRVAK
jgi:hypothetical protein